MVPVTDLPRTPLAGELVVLALIEPDEIADMLTEPPRRRDEWHPDFPREDDRDGVRIVADGHRLGSAPDRAPRPTAWWSARSGSSVLRRRPTTACPRSRSATAWSPRPGDRG